ncbi:TetR/AcrR family transcriptional regulator [Microtetraspora malaysiensis]|uniref:TetR/AcrR family transcriptional regulator n=1 Tax=Microtetraspora malaysiensis TaxID=161358 RepID=UPI000831559D|nr:TetR/AcrR family transcriptional regulator [Microtetraspora malaysiensis]
MKTSEEDAGAPRARRRGRPPRDLSAPATPERILLKATELFAVRGFDGVSMRDIAGQVGIDVSSVHHHFPSKAELCEACFARVFALERATLEPSVRAVAEAARTASHSDLVGAMHRLVDTFVDFLDEHPHTTFLWLRRWLDPTRHSPLDEAYALPIYHEIEQALLDAAARGLIGEPTPHVTVRSLVWAAHGHVAALTAAGAGAVAVARERREFRAYAHRLIDLLYAPPGARGSSRQ